MIDASTNTENTLDKPNLEGLKEEPAAHPTPNEISIDGATDDTTPTGALTNLKAEKPHTPPQNRATQSTHQPSDALMGAFINTVSSSLSTVSQDYLTAAESGEIVVKCKLYLNSLLGNPTARRYIATTMLVVRNNYSDLNKQKREKIVDYLHTYEKVGHNPRKVESELLKLYEAGIRPI